MKSKPKYSYSQMEYLIDEFVVGRNSERNRKILKMSLLQGLPYREIAERVDMSDIQISRIVHKYGDPLLLMLE